MILPNIGCAQLNSQFDIESNLQTIKNCVIEAKQKDTHLLVLPENACRMGGQHELSERFDDISQWYADLAYQHKLFILAGTLPCPYRPDGTLVPNKRLRQVSQLFGPDGKRLARYDKIHLFRAQVSDNTGSYDEGKTFEPGDTTVVAKCDIANLLGHSYLDSTHLSDTNQTKYRNPGVLKIGMMVCFDLRFPALAQRLRQAGADIITAPSAFTYQTGKAHWQLLLRARALDSQCMVIGAAQGGTHTIKESERETWGHSSITNANGELIIETGETKIVENAKAYSLITTPFDQYTQQNWRQDMPIHHCHRLA